MLRILRQSINHIKDMREQAIKSQMRALLNTPPLQKAEVYKPTKTIQFNRQGQILLYDCDPVKHQNMYLKYPYVMYQTTIPLSVINYFYNPLDLSFMWTGGLMLASLCFAGSPRFGFYFDMPYWSRRIYLLRGGRVLKFQGNTMFGTKRYFWVQTQMCRPLTRDRRHFLDKQNGQFLQEQGQLAYQLNDQGVNMQDIIFKIKKEGKVLQPQLFQAALKGFNIDTTDFVINTADNQRVYQGHHNG